MKPSMQRCRLGLVVRKRREEEATVPTTWQTKSSSMTSISYILTYTVLVRLRLDIYL